MDRYTIRWVNIRSLKSYNENKKIKGVKCHMVIDRKKKCEKRFKAVGKSWIVGRNFL